jgi:hypothetical protein
VKPAKKHALLLLALDALAEAAARVSWKYGRGEDGVPSDWAEWADLRAAIAEARHALAREGGVKGRASDG